MRLRTIVICAVIALGLSACGSSGAKSASRATPPTPVILSSFVTDAHVSLSPARVGAGTVLLTVTNQGARAEALVISTARRPRTVARTAPISSHGSTQLSVTLRPGRYAVALAAPGPRTDARRSRPVTRPAATLRVGRPRASADGDLLAP